MAAALPSSRPCSGGRCDVPEQISQYQALPLEGRLFMAAGRPLIQQPWPYAAIGLEPEGRLGNMEPALAHGVFVAKRRDGFKMTHRILLNAKFPLRSSGVAKCSLCWERHHEASTHTSWLDGTASGSWVNRDFVSGSWQNGGIMGSGWRANWLLSIKSIWGF